MKFGCSQDRQLADESEESPEFLAEFDRRIRSLDQGAQTYSPDEARQMVRNTIAFSWPSMAQISQEAYLYDQDRAIDAKDAFMELLALKLNHGKGGLLSTQFCILA